MGCGNGSHARLNNGFPFRTDKGFYVMMGYFANRKTQDQSYKLDYSGHVIVEVKEQDATANKFSADVRFVRKLFSPGQTRTIQLADLELTWTAPARTVQFIDGQGTTQGDDVDTFLTVSQNDGPYLTGEDVNEGILGHIYGLVGTDNEFDTPAEAMMTLEVTPPDSASGVSVPFMLKFSYDQAALKGIDSSRLGVVQWIVNGQTGKWVKLPEAVHVRETGLIRVQAIHLTWYALGIDFEERT